MNTIHIFVLGAQSLRSGFQRSIFGRSTWFYDALCNGTEESILNCSTRPITGYRRTNLCSNDNVGISCQQPTLGDLRILGGANSSAGRLEIFANNAWGTVCTDYWSRYDAQVACRQLGFPARGKLVYLFRFSLLRWSLFFPYSSRATPGSHGVLCQQRQLCYVLVHPLCQHQKTRGGIGGSPSLHPTDSHNSIEPHAWELGVASATVRENAPDPYNICQANAHTHTYS